jgi:dTDP-4-dehydrorhamnose 3,5-epimerase
MIEGAIKDGQLNTQDWDMLHRPIDGVVVREVKHIVRDHGVITEMYRAEWDPSGLPVVQSYQSRLFPGAIGAWSCHKESVDRLFINQGHVKLVLFDGREDSPTHGVLNEYYVGDARPSFVLIPTGVWHGLQNLGSTDALMINFPSLAYRYEDPDHYRLPWNSDKIPYDWGGAAAARLRAR